MSKSPLYVAIPSPHLRHPPYLLLCSVSLLLRILAWTHPAAYYREAKSRGEHSPRLLTNIFAALEEGSLSGKPHEAIALRVGQMHGCRYCTAAHTAKAKMAGATIEETIAYRKGVVDDQKLQRILDVAVSMVENRGKITDDEVQAARDAGVTDAELLEPAAIVACNTYTNYVNALVQTEVDFPAAPDIE